MLIPIEHRDFTLYNNTLIRIKQNEKWGAMDLQGNIVIPCEYRELKPVIQSFITKTDNYYNAALQSWKDKFLVKKDALWGMVNTKHEFIVPMEYNDIKALSFTVFGVKKGALWGAVNTKGAIVIPIEYTDMRNMWEASTFSFAISMLYIDFNSSWPGVVKVKKQKWGLIDTTAKIIIPLEYDDVRDCSKNLVKVKKGVAWGTLTKVIM